MAEHVHTYPVDPSLTPIEAWKELCIFGRRVTYTGTETWANTTCDGESCRLIEDSRDDPPSRFPTSAATTTCEFDHPHPSHPCGNRLHPEQPTHDG